VPPVELEGELVNWLQGARREGFMGVVFNPGRSRTTRSRCAIRWRRSTCGVEVHLSTSTRARNPPHSVIAAAARGQISGFGPQSYLLAWTPS